jgi:hypothetical protein
VIRIRVRACGYEDAIFTPRQQEIGGVFEAERADERFTVLVA